MSQEQSTSLPTTSPTSEQTPEIRLGDLFQKDPELLTNEDLDKIVSELRANRVRWQAEEQDAATQERKPKRSAGVNVKSLTLTDLGL